MGPEFLDYHHSQQPVGQSLDRLSLQTAQLNEVEKSRQPGDSLKQKVLDPDSDYLQYFIYRFSTEKLLQVDLGKP